tara:strand:- start:8445 stop:8918 length:474 start_codon:yes stop_codon:yes gene_type:complete
MIRINVKSIIIHARGTMSATDTLQHRSNAVTLAPSWLNHAEKNFIRFLARAVGDQVLIFTKVPVNNVLEQVPLFAEYPHYDFDTEVFDFVLCRMSDLAVVCVLRLDARKIPQQKHALADNALPSLCEDANIPYLEIPARCGYEIITLRQLLTPYIKR